MDGEGNDRTVKLSMEAGSLLDVVTAMDDVFPVDETRCESCGQRTERRFPIGLSVKVGRMRRVVAEFHAELMVRVGPLIQKHTGGDRAIGPGHEGHPEFVVEAGPYFGEVVELELEPITLAELEAVEGLDALPDSTQVLIGLGFITDTTEGADP